MKLVTYDDGRVGRVDGDEVARLGIGFGREIDVGRHPYAAFENFPNRNAHLVDADQVAVRDPYDVHAAPAQVVDDPGHIGLAGVQGHSRKLVWVRTITVSSGSHKRFGRASRALPDARNL